MNFRTESKFIAPVKYPALSLLAVSTKIAKMAWGTLPQETCAVIIAEISASDLSAAFLDKEHVYTADAAILWAVALGPACAARADLVARPLTPLAACAAPSVGLLSLSRPHQSSTTPRHPSS